MSHTPGPWKARDGVGQYANEVAATSARGKDVVVARIAGGPMFRDANARLIAAAPDLLEALHEAGLQIEYLHERFERTSSGVAALSRIDAAIAKAEGK